MNPNSNRIDENFDYAINAWKEDFEAPNPYLSNKIIEKIELNSKRYSFPISLSKFAIAAIIFFGVISGYLLHNLFQLSNTNNNINISEQSSDLNTYKNEMYISDLKFDEVENLVSEK